MGLFDFFTTTNRQETGDPKQRASDALRFYHNSALLYSGYPYGSSFQEFISYLDGLDSSFRERLGKVLISTNLSNSTIQKAYEGLAASALGNVPKNAGDLTPFMQSLADTESSWDVSRWIGTVKDATVDTAKEVAVAAGLGLGVYALLGVFAVAAILVGRK